MDITISRKTSHIRSCRIDIKLKAILKKGIVKSLVYITIRITILLFTSIVILIYYTATAKDRDLLFEPNNTLVTLFVQLANKDIKSILARNNSNKLVLLP